MFTLTQSKIKYIETAKYIENEALLKKKSLKNFVCIFYIANTTNIKIFFKEISISRTIFLNTRSKRFLFTKQTNKFLYK